MGRDEVRGGLGWAVCMEQRREGRAVMGRRRGEEAKWAVRRRVRRRGAATAREEHREDHALHEERDAARDEREHVVLPEGAAAQVVGLLVALVRVARRQHRLRLVQVRHVPVACRAGGVRGARTSQIRWGPRQAGGARHVDLQVVEGSKKACGARLYLLEAVADLRHPRVGLGLGVLGPLPLGRPSAAWRAGLAPLVEFVRGRGGVSVVSRGQRGARGARGALVGMTRVGRAGASALPAYPAGLG